MINELKDRAYDIACEHGWYDEEQPLVQILMLVITELSEAVQADRKGRHADKCAFLMSIASGEELPYKCAFEAFIKDTVEDELADAVIRLLSLAGHNGIVLYEELFSEGKIRESVAKREGKFLLSVEIFTVIKEITGGDNVSDVSLINVMMFIFIIAYSSNIDLYWYIEQKMKYNESRPYKHGCKF